MPRDCRKHSFVRRQDNRTKTFFGRLFEIDCRPSATQPPEHQLELCCSLRNENIPTKSEVSSIFGTSLSLSPTVLVKSQYSSIHPTYLYSFELDVLQSHRKVTPIQFATTNDKNRRSSCPYSLTVIRNHHSNQRV
jgi:hypothetical protein